MIKRKLIKDKTLGFRVDEKLFKQIQSYAKKNKVTTSEFARQLFHKGLGDYKHGIGVHLPGNSKQSTKKSGLARNSTGRQTYVGASRYNGYQRHTIDLRGIKEREKVQG